MGEEAQSGEVRVEELIKPERASMDVRGMSRAEPGLPAQFTWRGERYTVAAVLKRWKETGPCWSGSGEQYVRKHWFLIRTTEGLRMTLYFERQARSSDPRERWWLHSLRPREGSTGEA